MPDMVKLSNTVDLQKIQELMSNLNVSILVGFPSGRPHIEAIHEVQDDGSYKGKSDVQKSDTGKPIETAELAADLYYGTATTPARPFLTDGIEAHQEEIRQAVEEEVKKEVDGTGKANWNKVGTMAVGAITEFVRGDYYKKNIPNSAEWQRIKKGDTPLIDSGDLINSLSFIVEK